MLSFALVVLDRNVILGPGLGLEAQVCGLKSVDLALRIKSLFLSLGLKAKSLGLGLEAQVLTLMCYGATDIIDWSYILPYNRSVTQYSCQLSGTLSLAFVVLNNKTVVLGPGLGA